MRTGFELNTPEGGLVEVTRRLNQHLPPEARRRYTIQIAYDFARDQAVYYLYQGDRDRTMQYARGGSKAIFSSYTPETFVEHCLAVIALEQ